MGKNTKTVIAVKKMVVHIAPHVDEVFAIFAMIRYGGKLLKGAAKAKIEFSGVGTFIGIKPEVLEKRGTILIGCGGGRFDEHTEERQEGDCAFVRVLNFLDLHSRFRRLAEILIREDNKAGLGEDGFGTMLKTMWHYARGHNIESKVILDWALQGAEALSWAFDEGKVDPKDSDEEIFSFSRIQYYLMLWSKQNGKGQDVATSWSEFYLKAKEWNKEYAWPEAVKEYKKNREMYHVECGGKQMRIVVIESDNELMSKVSRSNYGDRANVVIHRQVTDGPYTRAGLFQIHTANPKWGDRVYLLNVVRALRQAEADKKDIEVSKQELSLDSLEKLPNMYWHRNGNMFLNGSHTALEVEPSVLSTEEITELVVDNVDWMKMKKSRKKGGNNGRNGGRKCHHNKNRRHSNRSLEKSAHGENVGKAIERANGKPK